MVLNVELLLSKNKKMVLNAELLHIRRMSVVKMRMLRWTSGNMQKDRI